LKLLRLLSWIEVVVAAADFCVSLISKRRRWLSREAFAWWVGRNPWVHLGWTGGVTDGLEVMMGLVMIDINGAALPNFPHVFGVGCCLYTDFVT